MIQKGYVLKDVFGRFYEVVSDDFVKNDWQATFYWTVEDAEEVLNSLQESGIGVIRVPAEWDGVCVKVVKP